MDIATQQVNLLYLERLSDTSANFVFHTWPPPGPVSALAGWCDRREFGKIFCKPLYEWRGRIDGMVSFFFFFFLIANFSRGSSKPCGVFSAVVLVQSECCLDFDRQFGASGCCRQRSFALALWPVEDLYCRHVSHMTHNVFQPHVHTTQYIHCICTNSQTAFVVM